MGFGESKRLQRAGIWPLSEDLPLVIEIVDNPERIEAFLPDLDELIQNGLVTLEKLRVIAYRRNADKDPDGANDAGLGPLPDNLKIETGVLVGALLPFGHKPTTQV